MINHIALTYSCNKSCSFCIAKDLINKKGQFISLVNFEKALDWFLSQNIKHVSLFGGEPSLHPKLKEIIKIIKNKGMTAGMITNGLFDYRKIKGASPKIITNYLINFNPENHYTKKEWELMHSLLKKLSNIGNIITLSYNISISNMDYSIYLDACKRYNIKKIRFSLTAPSFSSTNSYSGFKEMEKLVPTLLSFTNDAYKEKISLELDGPLPFCLFTSRERMILKRKAGLYGTCSSGEKTLVVNPDLSVYPCLPIMIKGPELTSFKKREDIFSFYKSRVNKMKWGKYLLPKCDKCKHKIRRECQGGCLSYFIS